MQRATRVRRRHPAAQKERILAAYEKSGLTQKEFAGQAGIGYSTLTLWLRKRVTVKPSGRTRFVPVPNLFSAAASAPAYRLQFPRGVLVEVAPGFQSEELSALLKVVQGL
jgi:transposase-like protein